MAIIIALVGEKLAGKDTTAEYLVTNYGAEHIRHSHIIDDILSILHIPITRRNENDLGYALRGTFGTDVISRALMARVSASASDIIVTNGMRFPEELEDLQKLGAHVIYITAPKDTRYRRVLARHEKGDDQQSLEKFEQQEQEVYEVNVPSLGAQADYRIDNNGSVDELHRSIETIMATLTTGKQNNS